MIIIVIETPIFHLSCSTTNQKDRVELTNDTRTQPLLVVGDFDSSPEKNCSNSEASEWR